jgi:hypothetical protein
MVRAVRRAGRLILVLALPLALLGCEDGGEIKLLPDDFLASLVKSGPPPEPAPKPRGEGARDAVVAGTVGEQTLVADLNPVTLRGFGLVVGLDGTGSTDCPTSVRDYLIDFLAKQIALQGRRKPTQTPAELIDSPDTAVVEVAGTAPAGARSGTRFDLRIQALAGTSTTSLAGGLLLPTEMRIFDASASGEGLFFGAVLAEAGGPAAISPFAESAQSASDADPRVATVLGGGRTLEARTARLALSRPNYQTARVIERRVNERFGQNPRAASAQSAGYVELTTPAEFAPRPELFHRVIAYLPMEREPGELERRLNALSDEAGSREGDYEPISLSWEAIGRAALPSLQPFYAGQNSALRFYAARAGLRLGDSAALVVMGELARDAPHAERILAIRELSFSSAPQAPLRLVKLLDDRDQEIRIAAYEALVQLGHNSIRSSKFPLLLDRAQLNFSLDVVDSSGPPLIYIRRTRLPRIAVFGRQAKVNAPVFYTLPDDALTIHTVDGSNDLSLFAKRNGKLSPQVIVPPRAVDLVAALGAAPTAEDGGKLRGLGLPFSRVVQVLADLCRDETIAAPLVFEQATITDILGPRAIPARPEGETRTQDASEETEPAAPDVNDPADGDAPASEPPPRGVAPRQPAPRETPRDAPPRPPARREGL